MHPSDSPDRRVAPAHVVPPAATDEIDAIMEAVSAGEPPARGPDARRDTIAPSLASPTIARSTRRALLPSPAARIAIPCILAFVCGSLIAVWAVRSLERRAPIQRASASATSRHVPDTPEKPAPSPRLILGRHAWPTMGPLTMGIEGTRFARVARVSRGDTERRRAPAAPALVTPALVTPVLVTPAPVASVPVTPTPVAPFVALAIPPAHDSTAIIGSLPVVDAAPAAPHPIRGGETDAVRRTIAQYEAAIDQMNVGAAAAVFPSVDTLALTRAFSAVKEQGVDFERCDVAIMTATATVRCLGTTHYVVKVGTPTPRRRRCEWTFTLEKVGNAWKIGDMATTAIGRSPAQR
jgi:hypothetical protein